MIFVTVGTHEDSFDRLLLEIDRLKGLKAFPDEVFIQSGYSRFKPVFCRSEKLIGYETMDEYIKNARIIITHGGPSSVLHAMRYGRVPIVVPRQKQFKEHVEDHQVFFCRKFQSTGAIIPVFDISSLKEKIKNYEIMVKDLGNVSHVKQDNLSAFTESLEKITRRLFAGR